jgi:serine protease Do
MQASVYVNAGEEDAEAPHGSGVIISDRAVLTNAHVAKSLATKAVVSFLNGEKVEGKVAWMSQTSDVALIEVDVPDGYVPARATCEAPSLGQEVVVVGNPMIVRWSVVYGRVAALTVSYGKLAEYGSMALDITTAPGNSGSPVFDMNGRLVGLVHGQLLQPAGMMAVAPYGLGLMIPMANVCDQLGI